MIVAFSLVVGNPAIGVHVMHADETTAEPQETPEPTVTPSPTPLVITDPVTGISMQYTMKSIYPEKTVTEKTELKDSDTLEVWVGDKITLTPTVTPDNATDKTLIFESNNTTMATVSEKGVVKVKNMGDATITATSLTNPEISFKFNLHAYKNAINVVTDMGAMADDGVSDTKAIKSALAQAQYLNEGDELSVKIPKGTYDTDGVMYAYSNTKLTLASKTIMKRATSAGGKSMLRSHADESIKGYNQIKNFTVTGGTWDGNADGSGSSDLLYFGHGQNITIKDTTVKNTCGEHLIELAGINGATVENVKLSGYTLPKTEVSEYTPLKEAIQLDYCSAASTPSMVPHDNTACKDITITGCTISNYMCGIGAHGITSGVHLNDINIIGNTFSKITNVCIDARNFKNLLVKDNKAEAVNEFFYGLYSSGVIKGNTIKYKSFSKLIKVLLNTPNGVELIQSDFSIVSNTIQGMKNGIYLGTGTTATVQKNKIKKNKKYGIYTYRANVTFKSNTLSGNKKGVFYTNKEATIKSSDDIRSYYVDLKSEYKYTGKKIKPIKKIENLSKKYYTVKYKNNVKKGTATAIIKGKGKVKKTNKLKFKIV